MWRQGHDYMILCCLILFKVITAGEVGEECSPTEEISKGTCKVISDCKVALSFIQSTEFHPFSRCGFRDKVEIVCCPYNYIQPPTQTKGQRPNTSNKGQEKYGSGGRIADRVGEECSPTEEISKGTCIVISDCKVALSFIQSTEFHPFSRCGFREKVEIVCCPNNYIQPPTQTKGQRPNTSNKGQEKYGSGVRIADRECQKIVASTLPPLETHVIGGKNASLGEFAHMVSLGYNISDEYEFRCGGSLISDTYVLTAAHCVQSWNGMKPVMARMGVINIGDGRWNNESDVRIEKIINHPDYVTRLKYNDIALLKLEHPVMFSPTLSPICLFTKNEDPSVSLTVTGWGKINTTRNDGSSYLQKATVVVVSKSKCEEAHPLSRQLPRSISNEQICAGDPMGLRDTCQGDSGGPLQGLTNYDGFPRLVGVTSYGRGCGSPVPGVYTRVSRYLDWIESVVWPNQP